MGRKARKRNYGSGSVKEVGGRWRFAARVNGQRIQKAGFLTRQAAEDELAKVLKTSPKKALLTGEQPTMGTLFALWSKKRELSHRSTDDDILRWAKHLAPDIGELEPKDVTQAMVKSIVETKRASGLSGATVRLIVRLLSTFMADLLDDGWIEINPAKNLPKAVRALARPTYDRRLTPFVKTLEEVKQIYDALKVPFSVAYAIGAFAGLRTSEVRALRWENVDLKRRVITVSESIDDDEVGPTKSGKSRPVIIFDTLYPVLVEWKKWSKGELVCPGNARSPYMTMKAMSKALEEVLVDLKLKTTGLSWYRATRHTFASHYVMNGGSIIELRDLLGHSSIVVTEGYAHLVPNHSDERRAMFKIAL